MKRSYSLEEKLCAIGFVFQGESARSVSRRFHLGHHILYEWLESYKLQGVDGLKSHGHKKKRLSYEEKCKIVREHLVESVSLTDLRVKYGIGKTTINRWCRIVESQGYKALNDIQKRGRPPKDMGRPKKKKPEEMTELERLRYENECLRTENALLKKVRALVEERNAHLRETGQKPSKN